MHDLNVQVQTCGELVGWAAAPHGRSKFDISFHPPDPSTYHFPRSFLYLSLVTAVAPDQVYALSKSRAQGILEPSYSNNPEPNSLGVDMPSMEPWLKLRVERSGGSDRERAHEVVGSGGGDLIMVDRRPKNFSRSICFPDPKSRHESRRFSVQGVWFDTQDVAKFHNDAIHASVIWS